MKSLICLITVAMTLAGVATDGKPAKKILTPEEKAANIARIKEKYYQNTGGRVFNVNSGSGKVIFVNAQKRVDETRLHQLLNDLMLAFGIRLELKSVAAGTIEEMDKVATSFDGAATIFIVDDKKLPLSLVAYEARWGAVNLAKFPEATAALQMTRIYKLSARTFAQTCGVAYGAGISGLMGPVGKAEALDGCVLNDRVNPMITGPIHKYLTNFGVSPMTVSTYRQACRDGWAPQPTNDVQKALWEKAKERREKGPSNPLTIKPPKK